MDKLLKFFIKNPKYLNELLQSIDEWARKYNSEYGLPVYSDYELSKMREIILQWFVKMDSVDYEKEK